MNTGLGYIKMKEYGLNDMKLFRLNDGNQHCKIWFTNDGINIIPIWYKRLLVEYVMFY
jgi:LPS sulfotransferase NodH